LHPGKPYLKVVQGGKGGRDFSQVLLNWSGRSFQAMMKYGLIFMSAHFTNEYAQALYDTYSDPEIRERSLQIRDDKARAGFLMGKLMQNLPPGSQLPPLFIANSQGEILNSNFALNQQQRQAFRSFGTTLQQNSQALQQAGNAFSQNIQTARNMAQAFEQLGQNAAIDINTARQDLSLWGRQGAGGEQNIPGAKPAPPGWGQLPPGTLPAPQLPPPATAGASGPTTINSDPRNRKIGEARIPSRTALDELTFNPLATVATQTRNIDPSKVDISSTADQQAAAHIRRMILPYMAANSPHGDEAAKNIVKLFKMLNNQIYPGGDSKAYLVNIYNTRILPASDSTKLLISTNRYNPETGDPGKLLVYTANHEASRKFHPLFPYVHANGNIGPQNHWQLTDEILPLSEGPAHDGRHILSLYGGLGVDYPGLFDEQGYPTNSLGQRLDPENISLPHVSDKDLAWIYARDHSGRLILNSEGQPYVYLGVYNRTRPMPDLRAYKSLEEMIHERHPERQQVSPGQ
jgi:hypothetical protein